MKTNAIAPNKFPELEDQKWQISKNFLLHKEDFMPYIYCQAGLAVRQVFELEKIEA